MINGVIFAKFVNLRDDLINVISLAIDGSVIDGSEID